MVSAVNRNLSVIPGDVTGAIKPQNLEQAAEQFEGLFLRSMIKEMRKSSDALFADNPFESKQQKMLRDFYDDKMALHLATTRSSGIAQMIIAQLGPQTDNAVKNPQDMVALIQNPKELKTTVIPKTFDGKE
jgi:flagellar protein FlgJ